MAESPELMEKLNQADPEIQHYVAALKSEFTRLHKRIAKLEAENVSLESRIEAIKEGQPSPADQMDPEEIVRRFLYLASELGYTATKKE